MEVLSVCRSVIEMGSDGPALFSVPFPPTTSLQTNPPTHPPRHTPGIIVSINFNITSSRAALNAYPWSSQVPLQYKALASFNLFRVLFLAYLLLPTLLLVARVMLVAWPYAWVDPLLRHALYLALFVALAVAFAPVDVELYRRPFALEPWRGAEGEREERAPVARGGAAAGAAAAAVE